MVKSFNLRALEDLFINSCERKLQVGEHRVSQAGEIRVMFTSEITFTCRGHRS